MEALFLRSVGDGGIFAIWHKPVGNAVGSVVYVHPFAEEMNKSRRMAALQARAFAAAGWHVLQVDLFGCGDSRGDFGDASWERWIQDVAGAARWFKERTGLYPVLWGLRAGCLLTVAALSLLEGPRRLLCWNPVVSGRQHLQQFLRLKLAGDVLGGREGGGGKALKDRLLGGEPQEIGGYMLSPDLARGLDEARLQPLAPAGRMLWLDTSSADPPAILPVGEQAVKAWRMAGWSVFTKAVRGPAFWQTQEIEEVPALLGVTMAALQDLRHDALP